MDAIEKLEDFYQRCNDSSMEITRESTLQNLSDLYDKLAIEESLDGGTLTDEALVMLRKLNFTYKEIATLFDEKPDTIRQRARRLKVGRNARSQRW